MPSKQKFWPTMFIQVDQFLDHKFCKISLYTVKFIYTNANIICMLIQIMENPNIYKCYILKSKI